jgi:hypothetical protein
MQSHSHNRSRYYQVQQGEIKGPYWLALLVAFDEFCNVLLLGGNPHETISQHCAWDAYTRRAWWAVNTIYDFLQYFFPGHCAGAICGVVRPSTWTG